MARPRGGDWLDDEMKALRDEGVNVVVSMLTPAEASELDLRAEQAAAERVGVRFINLPTPDRGIPEIQDFRALVTELAEGIRDGEHVVVHCRMGIGRSSMVAAAVLMAEGLRPRDAWNAVAQARGLDVPDTPEQRAWVEAAITPGQ
jgi:protein-tyrosine phosphatase